MLWLKAITPPISAITAEITGRLARSVEGIPKIAPPVTDNEPKSINTPCIIDVIDAPNVSARIIQLTF